MKPTLMLTAALLALGHPRPAAAGQTAAPEYMKAAGARTFTIEYTVQILEVPENAKTLRVWVPVPRDSTAQRIRGLAFSSPPKITTESKYGNRIAFWEIAEPPAFLELVMRFECERREVVMDLERLARDGREDLPSLGKFLKPGGLVLVDDEIRQLSNEIAGGKESSLDKARAIYEYVLEKMTYDKNHPGWGFGSTRHACDTGKGNCTDFHALFNSLCRAQGIASGFEIGLYLPYEKGKEGPLGGYHCWAWFRVPGKSWVPVDCSEADRFPKRREYFFGGHTSNRVALSEGRDIILEPRQKGAPLNYFLNPYAEADGAPVKTGKSWTFQDR